MRNGDCNQGLKVTSEDKDSIEAARDREAEHTHIFGMRGYIVRRL